MSPVRAAWEVFLVFLRLGLVSFGGPAAHTALFEAEFVERRRWISRDRFLEAISLTQLIPGPNSTELAMHIGFARARWAGFLAGGLGFILPAAVLVAALANGFERAGGYAAWSRWIWGAKATVAALVVIFVLRALPRAFRNRWVLLPAALGLGLLAAGASVWTAFLAPTACWLLPRFRAWGLLVLGVSALGFLPALGPLSAGAREPTLGALFSEFFFLGSIILGSGYVLFAYLQCHVVERLHWATSAEMATAVVLGQVTPGPLFATAAFFGETAAGPLGAVATMVGIFLPAFLFSALGIAGAERFRTSAVWERALEPLVALSFTLLAWEAWGLRDVFVPTWEAFAFFEVALVVAAWGRVPSTWILVAGALAGGLLSR